MNTLKRIAITVSVLPALLIGLPLLGIMLAGKDVSQYAEFPPLTRYVPHAPFSWPAFIALALAIMAGILFFDIKVLSAMGGRRLRNGEKLSPGLSTFPWWGWLGLAAMTTSWVLAWTRFEWFQLLQQFTFSPLWFSFILLINALTFWRSGRCMLRNRPAYFLALFPVSAGFWWFFEYLNRFVQNWYYDGVGTLTPLEYFLFATLPFSTVLPAVLGTYEFLKTLKWAGMGLDNYAPLNLKHPKAASWIMLAICSAGLAGIGIRPDYLFPLLWISPFLIITSVSTLMNRDTVLSDIRRGNWRDIYLFAMAALVCGLLWEMWNYFSLARWIYAVPYVGRFKLFEMPVLGFAGYLPFGLECAVVGGLVAEFTDMLTGKERKES